MSLESALDEERREVMALLEGRTLSKPSRPGDSGRAQSPAAAKSPIRSMLDIHDPITSPTASGPRSPGAASTTYRSMLDTTSPPVTPRSPRANVSPSPVGRNRIGGSSLNPEEAYQFEMLPTIEAHAMPKRVSQGGKKQPKAMSSVYGNAGDLLGSIRGDARGRHNSTTAMLGKRSSKSPSSRFPGARSSSPGGRKLNTNSFNLMADPNKYHTDSGKVIDMSSAYRRLSDAALVRSGGSLSTLPSRKGSDPTKGESVAPDGGVRLEKDYFADDDEDAVTSDDDDYSSEGEGWDSEKRRGRRRTRGKSDDANEASGTERRMPKSLLAAAEDERKEVSSMYTVRSLLEPTVTVTGPDGEKMSQKKTGVHPHTSFDQGGSGLSTPMTSDTEADLSEIHKAQRMALNMSPIHSSPEAHRCVRQILRGEYRRFQQEAEQGLRRQRVYLVATDLSEEAAYALEWTIGTVLRDGDTLLAVYAVDEETGVGVPSSSIGIGEGANAMEAAASLVRTLANEQPSTPGPSPLSNSTTAAELENKPDFSTMDKAERERWKATQEVSDRCVKLLRKTKLQVRVVVEVFHCKSPKHMITEVIDFLEPTLVILGSRGRSALKGVLLGSFSNYLVTKSSVPVMVARKRLRKHSKYKRTNLRLSNVLTSPTSRLVNAKID